MTFQSDGVNGLGLDDGAGMQSDRASVTLSITLSCHLYTIFLAAHGATVGGPQGTKKRNRNCKAPSDPEVTFVGGGSPPDGSGGDGPSSCPRMDEWVRGRAVCYVPVDAHVVSEGTVGAGGGGHIIFPEGCIVAVPQSGLEAKEPLMPRQATKLKWSPGGRMEIFLCV